MHYTQSSSPWSRAICHYVCHPPGRTVGQKTHPSGCDLSCARQRAMKGVSLFIRFDQPCELWAVYINTRFSFTGRSSTSLGESFANYHFAYASTPTQLTRTGCVALPLAFRDWIDILSLLLPRMIVERSSNIKLCSSYFSDIIRNLNDTSRDKRDLIALNVIALKLPLLYYF